MKLRDYQQECVCAIENAIIDEQDRALVGLPTAAGKTIIFCSLTQSWRRSVLILVNKNILVPQTVDKLSKFVSHFDIGIYNAGMREKDLTRPITVASVQSLINAKHVPHFEYLIIDECHRANMLTNSSYRKIRDRIRPRFTLGVTATPYTARESLIYGENKFWPELTYSISTEDLLERGYLCPLKVGGAPAALNFDLKGVKTTAGEYNMKHLEERIFEDRDKLVEQVKDALARTHDRNKIIWITCSIDHAKEIYEILQDLTLGISITHSQLSKTEREEHENQFIDGQARHLVSCLVATEGFDYPPADALVYMRPTKSKGLFVQSVGRILRLHESKKDALLLDYGQCVTRFGDPIRITFEEKELLKLCSNCYSYCYQDEGECPECEFVFEEMCEDCFNMKRVGESCTECEKIKEFRERMSVVESLDNAAFEYDWYIVSRFESRLITSKKGNHCLLISYYNKERKIFTQCYTQMKESKKIIGVVAFRSFVDLLLTSAGQRVADYIKANDFEYNFETVDRMIRDGHDFWRPLKVKYSVDSAGYEKLIEMQTQHHVRPAENAPEEIIQAYNYARSYLVNFVNENKQRRVENGLNLGPLS